MSEFKVYSQCGNCKKRGSWDKCSSCRVTHYCSKECQAQDWKLHKPICKARAQYLQFHIFSGKCVKKVMQTILKLEAEKHKQFTLIGTLWLLTNKTLPAIKLTTKSYKVPSKRFLLHTMQMAFRRMESVTEAISLTINCETQHFSIEIRRISFQEYKTAFNGQTQKPSEEYLKQIIYQRPCFITQVQISGNPLVFSQPNSLLPAS